MSERQSIDILDIVLFFYSPKYDTRILELAQPKLHLRAKTLFGQTIFLSHARTFSIDILLIYRALCRLDVKKSPIEEIIVY